MRKRIALLLATLLLVLFVSVSQAEDYNYADLTDSELLEHLSELEAEIARRNINRESLMYPGTYHVGKDIIPGDYLVTGLNYHNYYIWFMNEDDYADYSELRARIPISIDQRRIDLDTTTKKHFVEGEVFVLSGGGLLKLEKFSANADWIP